MQFLNLAELVRQSRECYTSRRTRPDIVLVAQTLDVESWLAPKMPELHGHRKPLVLLVQRDEKSDDVGLLYKSSTAQAKWSGQDGKEGGPMVRLLSGEPDGLPQWSHDPLPLTPETIAGLNLCIPYCDEDSAAWLEGLMKGNLGVTLKDRSMQPGTMGRTGEIKVGETCERLQVICEPLPPNFLQLPAQQRSANPPPVPEIKLEAGPQDINMVVSNEPLPRKKRPRRGEQHEGEHSSDSESDGQNNRGGRGRGGRVRGRGGRGGRGGSAAGRRGGRGRGTKNSGEPSRKKQRRRNSDSAMQASGESKSSSDAQAAKSNSASGNPNTATGQPVPMDSSSDAKRTLRSQVRLKLSVSHQPRLPGA